jgi:hypothetical protein
MRTRIWAASASLACVAALVLAGCGTSIHRVAPNKLRELPVDQRVTMVGLLNGALAADQQAIFAYTIAGPLLGGRAQHAAGRFLGDVNTHAGVLRALIVRAGGTPHERSASYALGAPRTQPQVLELLQRLENVQIARYLGAIPRIASPWVRTVLASILADDAQHVTVLLWVQGRSRLQGAFVGGEPPTPRAPDPDALSALAKVELLAASIDARALRSGHLSPAARRLLGALISRARAHAQALEHALPALTPAGRSTSPRAGDVPRLDPRSWPRTRRAWLRLLELVQARVEGVFYTRLPSLAAPEALLAASIFAADAQQSVLLSELHSARIDDAIPASLVRGWCPPSGCTG